MPCRARLGPALLLVALAVPVPAAAQTVTATNYAFTPGNLTVTAGDTVTWNNVLGFHDVTFDDASFHGPSQPANAPWSVSRTFDTPGTFRYYCSVHGGPGGAGMSGIVTVQAAPSTTPQPSTGSSPTAGTPSPERQPTAAQPQALAKPKCISRRRFRIRIRRPQGSEIASAKVTVNGKRVAVERRRLGGRVRHTAQVDLRGLPKGIYKVRITVRTKSGKLLRGTRTYRTCAAPRGQHRLPPL